jgi:hypothetical protein
MPKVLFINATARTIEAKEIADGPAGIQKLLGGYVEVAVSWRNGDTLYVDEEGMLKPQAYFFGVPSLRPDQPFAGNGVLVGREIEGKQYPNGYTTRDPVMTVE